MIFVDMINLNKSPTYTYLKEKYDSGVFWFWGFLMRVACHNVEQSHIFIPLKASILGAFCTCNKLVYWKKFGTGRTLDRKDKRKSEQTDWNTVEVHTGTAGGNLISPFATSFCLL